MWVLTFLKFGAVDRIAAKEGELAVFSFSFFLLLVLGVTVTIFLHHGIEPTCCESGGFSLLTFFDQDLNFDIEKDH